MVVLMDLILPWEPNGRAFVHGARLLGLPHGAAIDQRSGGILAAVREELMRHFRFTVALVALSVVFSVVPGFASTASGEAMAAPAPTATALDLSAPIAQVEKDLTAKHGAAISPRPA